MLLLYSSRTTLAHEFAMVEQLDKGLYVEEVGRLSCIMTIAISQGKVAAMGSNKGQPNPRSLREAGILVRVEVTTNPNMRC